MSPTASFSNSDPVSGLVLLNPLSPGAVLEGQASVPVKFSDDVGLARAEFFMDDRGEWKLLAPTVLLSGLTDATDYTADGVNALNPVLVDTSLVPNGPHQLLVQVYDTAGNDDIAILNVIVGNPVPVNLDPGISLWLKELARPTTSGEAVGNAVATDSSRNSIVAGTFKGEVDFGGVVKTALGGSDIFLCKVNPDGVPLWVKTFGGTSNDSVVFVAVDLAGNIYTTGYFFGVVDFGGGPLTSHAGIYGSDLYVAKYSPDGTHLWSKHYGSTLGNNSGMGIAVDHVGNVIVAGKMYGPVDFGRGPISTRQGSADGFVLKLSGGSGSYIWAKNFGSVDSDTVKGVAVDPSGNVIVVGFSYAGIDFGDGVIHHQGSSDLFIVKYGGSNGRYMWSGFAGGPGPDTAEGVAVDAQGNIYVVGSYHNTIKLGRKWILPTINGRTVNVPMELSVKTVTLTAPVEAGVYVAKYTPSGIIQWARSIAYTTVGGGIVIRGLAVDSSGNVAVTGTVSGGVNFGNGVVGYGDANIFAAKYGPQGDYLWAKRSANLGRCAGFGIAVDNNRDIVITGAVQDAVEMDGLGITSPGPQIKSAFLYKVSA